jgi:large subunit ribosomal protein L24
MKIKKGDKVEIMTGDDKGTKGTVLKVFPVLNRVLVEGVNIVKKHQKSRVSGAKGTIVEKSLPIHASNVKKV